MEICESTKRVAESVRCERRVELVDRDSLQETNWAENTLGYVSKIPAYGRSNHKSAFRGWVLQEYAIKAQRLCNRLGGLVSSSDADAM